MPRTPESRWQISLANSGLTRSWAILTRTRPGIAWTNFMPAMLIGSVLWLAIRLRCLLRHRRRGSRLGGAALRLGLGDEIAELFTCLSDHFLHGFRHCETTLDQRFGQWAAASGYGRQ